jgi:hypothetical protein
MPIPRFTALNAILHIYQMCLYRKMQKGQTGRQRLRLCVRLRVSVQKSRKLNLNATLSCTVCR